MVSISSASAPARASDCACAVNAQVNSSALTSPETSILPAGPIDAKTSACVPAAFFEISTAARLIASKSAAELACMAIAWARKLLVRITWLPASTYVRATSSTCSGCVRFHVSGRAPTGNPRACNCVPHAPSLMRTPSFNQSPRPCISNSVPAPIILRIQFTSRARATRVN